ncbi:hypothetical protein B0T20DRAFT_86580 [Sordaria brevicollis]|uniref:Uncharacterized protein n=1 Tax=Sordaria brevicollis TaxID=83679 RepID=A0AAE0U2V5_SORBR|nr:hypothetical protein B0T20DRAFT_86580 [Sordaria brevicollis]
MILAPGDTWAAFIAHEWTRRTGHPYPPPPGPDTALGNDLEEEYSEILVEVWADILEESEMLQEENSEAIFFGPQRPPAWFHWVADHDIPPVFPTSRIPEDAVFLMDDIIWDGAFIILPQDPVPEPRDANDSHGPFWAPPPPTPRHHYFFPRRNEEFLRGVADGNFDHPVFGSPGNLLLDRPPRAPQSPQPALPREGTVHDLVNLVALEPPRTAPGWETMLTLLRPMFHDAPWRLEPATNIPEHILGRDQLEWWVNDAVMALIRRNRTLLQFINFDIRRAEDAAVAAAEAAAGGVPQP